MSETKAKKIINFKPKPFTKKDIFCLGGILLACLVLFCSGAILFLPEATSRTQREIVNDDYDTITAPIGEGDTLKQTLQAEGKLYGVRLKVATYNKVVHGNAQISILDEQNTTLATSTVDMSTLLDNTFYSFLFDTPVEASAGDTYTLQVTTTPETPKDTIGFWKSEGTVKGFTENTEEHPHYDVTSFILSQNEQEENGTLALQYTTRYAGNFIVPAYSFFAAFLTAFLLVLYWCLFVQKVQLHRVFLAASLCLGIVFMFLLPFRTAPDEYAHISTAYHYSNVLLGQPEIGPEGTVTVRSGDEMKLDNYDESATSIFAYQDLAEGLTAPTPKGEPVAVEARTLNVFPLLFAAPTLGITLAKILGLNQVWLLLFGRFANLLLFSIVGSRAIKKMPFAKPLLFCVGLLPMALQLAASFCYDTYLLAIAFYFIATVSHYAYSDTRITVKQVVWLAILAALLAPAKTIYLLLVAFIFILPAAKFPSKKFRALAQGGIIGAGILLWLVSNLAFLQTTLTSAPAIASGAEASSSQIGANGDALQFFTLGYILSHIPQTIKLVLLTIYEQSSLWLQGLLGGRLGEIIAIKIEINWIITIGLLIVVLLSALPEEKDTQILRPSNRWLSLGIFVCISALAVLACITWTPINYSTIFGVQGRYFLPVFPLALLAMRGKNLCFAKLVKNVLIFSMASLVVLTQLDAFFIIIAK